MECSNEHKFTWKGAGWRGCGHGHGDPHTSTAAVLTTAAATAGMTASTTAAAEHTLQVIHHTQKH